MVKIIEGKRGLKNHNSLRKQFNWPTKCSGALPGWILNQTRAFVGETVNKVIGIVSELTSSSDHSTVVMSDDNIREALVNDIEALSLLL